MYVEELIGLLLHWRNMYKVYMYINKIVANSSKRGLFSHKWHDVSGQTRLRTFVNVCILNSIAMKNNIESEQLFLMKNIRKIQVYLYFTGIE